MKDQDLGRQPNKPTLDDKERWEREKVEDDRRYQHFLETGGCISHEEMMAWFDELEQIAESKAQALWLSFR